MKKRIVNILTGGGGASLNRFYNGRDTFISNNYRRSCRDNSAVAHGEH